jgi:adenosylhomocysteine nucleosidase
LTAADSFSPIIPSPPSVRVPVTRIVIFAATSWEIGAVRAAFASGVERRIDKLRVYVSASGRREYWLAQTGVGVARAGEVASRLLTYEPFSLVVSTGFACALVAAEVGDILAGPDVVLLREHGSEPSSAIGVSGVERDAVLALVDGAMPAAHVGRFVTVDRIIGNASEKARFAHATGAIGLDMESAVLASEAQRARVPFVIVRAASDLLHEDLPLDFNLFLRPTGWLKGLATALGAPSSLLGLYRLRRQSLAAANTLTAFFRRYAAVMAGDGNAANERSLTD